MTKELTDKDRKNLRYEKRMGYVFAGLILSFGGIFSLYYLVLFKTPTDYLIVSLTDAGIILLAYFVCNRVNLKLNRDLKENTKELHMKRVCKKIQEKSYEAGSGALIPFLGDLFPKLWGQKMRESMKYFIITNDSKYEVDKEMYDYLKKDSDFYVHISKHSETILAFSIAD